MYQLVFFVPESHVEEVKNALFDKGAGRYEKYERCSWQSIGTGQYLPREDSRPFLGDVGQLQKVREFRVEMVCEDKILRDVLDELLRVHPYEEPAYFAVKVVV